MINNHEILKGITVLDFSHRLPGPLSGKILADYGATVIKIEDNIYKDAFLVGLFAQADESFVNWYEELNRNKQLVRLDFKAADASLKIAKYLDLADAIIMGPSPKLRANLGIDNDQLKNRKIATIELFASKNDQTAMHDLNAMAMSGLLSLFIGSSNEPIIPPPFLPIMGIGFGSVVATQLTGAILKSKMENKFITTNAYLYDDCLNLFSPFWPKADRQKKRTKFLHNGAFPCYCLYRLSDGHYAAVASVEDKFWESFIKIFNINLDLDSRFNTDIETFNQVANVLQTYDSKRFLEIATNNDICLSLVRKI